MNNATRRALNTIIENIEYLDDVLESEEYYHPDTTLHFKKELDKLVVSIVTQEADYKKNEILEAGYVDDISRIRKLLGVASQTEMKA